MASPDPATLPQWVQNLQTHGHWPEDTLFHLLYILFKVDAEEDRLSGPWEDASVQRYLWGMMSGPCVLGVLGLAGRQPVSQEYTGLPKGICQLLRPSFPICEEPRAGLHLWSC